MTVRPFATEGQPSLAQFDATVSQLADQVQIMTGDQHRTPHIEEAVEDAQDLQRAARVDITGRFIVDQQ